MSQATTYYLGRVVKLGSVTTTSLINAIREPPLVRRGDYVFTFTDIVVSDDAEIPRYLVAKLTKFTPEGAIAVVEPEKHVAAEADVANLLVASGLFIYIPDFSGIAYQNIWNRLEKHQFEKAFSHLVEEKHLRFFAQTAIEPIADLLTFVQHIAELDTVDRIVATVHPPNPLFGRAWKSLRDYMARRQVGEVHLREQSPPQSHINTQLPTITSVAVAPLNPQRIGAPELANVDIGDAAVLMAADGYGRARVEGQRSRRRVVVHTRDSQISFAFDRDPEPEALYEEASRILRRISEERYMEHP